MTVYSSSCPSYMEHVEDSVQISRKAYNKLLEDQRLLNAFKAAGVDNWDGYDYALELLNEDE